MVAGIQAGTIIIEPGHRLPVLRDAVTKRSIAGTGQPPQTGVSVQQAALRDFRERAIDDLPEAYALMMAGMRTGDPRWAKLYFENLLGKMGESKGGDAMVEAFRVFIDAMKTPEVRTVIIDQ